MLNHGVDLSALGFIEKVGVGGQCGVNAFQKTRRLDFLLAQFAQLHIFFGMTEGVFQDAADFIFRQTIRRLDRNGCFHARGLFAGRDRQKSVGVDLKRHTNTSRTGNFRWNAAQREFGQRAALFH